MQHVTFRPPAIGSSVVPIKLTGEGTVELSEEGLTVTAQEVASSGRGLMILLGLLAFGLLMAFLKLKMGLPEFYSLLISGFVGGMVLLPALRKPAAEGAEVTHFFPWSTVKKVTWDGSSECMVVVIKGTKPRGGLYLYEPEGSALQKELEGRLQAASAK